MRRSATELGARAWLVAVTLATLVPAVSVAAGPEVRFDSGRLWVQTDGETAAHQLLEAISEQTGVEFSITPELAAGRLAVDIDGFEIERALRQIVTLIPEAGGHTMSYVQDADGKPRVERVTVFGVGEAAPADSPARAEGGPAEAAAVTAPTPSAEDLDSQKEHLIEIGVREDTAHQFIEIMSDIPRLQKTPGAVDELMQSDRYRELMHEIAEAQGKVPGTAEESPAR